VLQYTFLLSLILWQAITAVQNASRHRASLQGVMAAFPAVMVFKPANACGVSPEYAHGDGRGPYAGVGGNASL
jgi:hypothetical protein